MSSLLSEHFGYLSDAVRLRRFAEAISAVVREGDTVVDIGCGSGVLGLLALRAGAGRVHCIDETSVLEVARRTLVDAGFGSRAAFHLGRAQQIQLPERADVVMCDHVGHFGFDYGILEMLRDATCRFLKPEGIVIPAELRLSVAAASSDECQALTTNWRSDRIPAEYHWVSEIAREMKHGISLNAQDLISHPAHLATVFPGTEAESYYAWTAQLVATRD